MWSDGYPRLNGVDEVELIPGPKSPEVDDEIVEDADDTGVETPFLGVGEDDMKGIILFESIEEPAVMSIPAKDIDEKSV